jgi:hypothetical protein
VDVPLLVGHYQLQNSDVLKVVSGSKDLYRACERIALKQLSTSKPIKFSNCFPILRRNPPRASFKELEEQRKELSVASKAWELVITR